MSTIEQIYSIFTKNYSLTTDSRKITPGCIFVALKGEHFDGNDFVKQAFRDGATAVIADRQSLPHHDNLFIVDNSLKTLQQLAHLHRKTLGTTIIGITGTNGKTTTKELTATALSPKYELIATQGNFNNHLGVPLTLLRLRPSTQLAVVEMGANHPGEIAELCSIVEPNYAIITNIGKAHLEGFGSYQNIIATKQALYTFVNEHQGTCFVNNDDSLLMSLAKKRFTYSSSSQNGDINISIVKTTPYLSIKYKNSTINTHLVGGYNAHNIAAALCVAAYFKVDESLVIRALEEYVPSNNRSQYIHGTKNDLIMDAYNANPSSMREALMNFAEMKTPKPMLILGDMRELGDASEEEHLNIIKLIKDLHFNDVILIGEEMRKAAKDSDFKTFNNIDEVKHFFLANDIKGYTILIKGSHSLKMEELRLED